MFEVKQCWLTAGPKKKKKKKNNGLKTDPTHTTQRIHTKTCWPTVPWRLRLPGAKHIYLEKQDGIPVSKALITQQGQKMRSPTFFVSQLLNCRPNRCQLFHDPCRGDDRVYLSSTVSFLFSLNYNIRLCIDSFAVLGLCNGPTTTTICGLRYCAINQAVLRKDEWPGSSCQLWGMRVGRMIVEVGLGSVQIVEISFFLFSFIGVDAGLRVVS